MADAELPRPKRKGNYYIPPHIKVIEAEVAARYANNESAKSLAKEYGISKGGVRGCIERNGGQWRDKKTAGLLLRRVDYELTPEEIADQRSIAQQVAEKHGYGTSKGLSFDREFRTLCAKERRRRNPDKYRDIDNRRKLFLNRIPAWVKRSELEAIYQAAKAAKLHVDHDVPLINEIVGTYIPYIAELGMENANGQADAAKITPEMIEAGERVLTTTIGAEEWFYSSARDVAVSVYLAMSHHAPHAPRL